MASRIVSGTIATVVLVLCVGVHSSAADESENAQKEIAVDLGDGVTMKFALIPAGEFMMGSKSAEALAKDFEDEYPQHRVKITRPFYLGVYEVTQQQYAKVMGDKPWSGKPILKEGAEYPATYVAWENAWEFCRKLSSKEGRAYRLPTEGEWEYACRAGSKTRHSFGDDESELGTYAWYDANARDTRQMYAHQVGLKKPNAWGLYDMHGNVSEWCQDCYDGDYYANSPRDDPTGPRSGQFRVYRGGGWSDFPWICRSAFRFRAAPGYRGSGYRDDDLGFRVALVPAE